MSYQRSYDELDVVDKPGCVHLRSKAMYVTGKLEPADQDEDGSHGVVQSEDGRMHVG